MLNRRIRYRFCSWFLLALAGAPMGVQAALDLPVPDNARVVYQSQVEAPDYVLVLGTYRRINNEWRIQNQSRVTGILLSKTLEFPRNSSERSAYVKLRDAIPAERRRELFSCQGLLCGSSNAWANTHFKKATLYGIDANQSYGVYETISESGQQTFTVIYTTQRGNGSVFAQVDRLQSLAQTSQALVTPAASIANSLAETGAFNLPLRAKDDNWVLGADQARELVEFMNDQATRTLVLVGHWDEPGEASVARSAALVERILADLKTRGLKREVLTLGVGNRAPAGREVAPARVVLVRN